MTDIPDLREQLRNYLGRNTPDHVITSIQDIITAHNSALIDKVMALIGDNERDTLDAGEKINKRDYLIFLLHRNQLREQLRAGVEKLRTNLTGE